MACKNRLTGFWVVRLHEPWPLPLVLYSRQREIGPMTVKDLMSLAAIVVGMLLVLVTP
jgi:hypothetical protein